MVQLGPDYDLAVRLKSVEERLARLEANPYGQAFSSNQSDGSMGLVIAQDPSNGATALYFRQGPTTTTDSAGNHPVFFYMGQLNPTTLPYTDAISALGHAGAVVSRQNGRVMLVLGEGGVQVFDGVLDQYNGVAENNILIATNEVDGEGLAWPPVSLQTPVSSSFSTAWPNTSLTSDQIIAACGFTAVYKQVVVYTTAYGNGGGGSYYVRAYSQVTNSTGSPAPVVGPTHTITSGAYASNIDTLTLPAGFCNLPWVLEVHATASSGNVAVNCYKAEARGQLPTNNWSPSTS